VAAAQLNPPTLLRQLQSMDGGGDAINGGPESISGQYRFTPSAIRFNKAE
jgi:hypothetical protein